MMNEQNKPVYAIIIMMILFDIIFGYIFYLNEMRDFNNYAKRAASMFSYQLSEIIDNDLEGLKKIQKKDQLTKYFKNQSSQTGILNIALFDQNGHIIYQSTPDLNLSVLKNIEEDNEKTFKSGFKNHYQAFDETCENVFVTSAYVKDSNGIFLIDIDMSKEYHAALNDVELYISVLFILSVLFSLLLFFIIRKYSRHINHYIMLIKRQKEAAIHLSNIKAEFLATMSHEIRTPVNGFLGVLDLLRDTRLTGKQKELLDIAHYSGRHLMTILNDILDFSKIEAGHLKVETLPIPLVKHLESIISMNMRVANNKGIDLVFKNRIDTDLWVVADPVRIAQIIQNLISNAIKFTHQGGVTLSVDYDENEDFKKSNKVGFIFTIRDSGIGIPEDRLPFLFDKFTQADASTTRLYGGTGLGLAISKKIVNILGGRIWVESTVGKGTTFYVLLHFEKAETPLVEEEIASPEIGLTLSEQMIEQKLNVLIVDDNLVNQVVLKGMIEKEGHIVVCASRGKEAIELTQKFDFDIIFMDIQMPEMDGFETTKHIRDYYREQNKPHPPFIACSASALYDQETKSDLEIETFQDELTKPIDRGKLKTILTGCIKK